MTVKFSCVIDEKPKYARQAIHPERYTPSVPAERETPVHSILCAGVRSKGGCLMAGRS
jgi:hypothetical protein